MLRSLASRSLLLAALAACGPGTADTDGDPAACMNGGELPAAGSACAEEGAVCQGPVPECGTPGKRVCEKGEWVEVPGEPCDTTSGTTTDAPTTGSTGGMAVPCGPDLPPDGSPCATPGEDCAPDADPCAPYTGALCTDGAWSHYEVGPGDPMQCQADCDPFPVEGQPCTVEGASCSTGCANQCEFCNLAACEGGVWQNIEVFPAPCLDCPGICEFTVVPMCAAGPPDQAECVAGCEASMAACELPFADTLACAGTMPTFSCDAQQRPEVAGCELEFAALYDCLGL